MSSRPCTIALFSASHIVRRAVRQALRGVPELQLTVVEPRGAEAPDLVEAKRPDLVVIDTFLPDVDAFELTRTIMARRPTPILLLAQDSRDDQQILRAIAAGAVHVSPPPPPAGAPGTSRAVLTFVELLRALAGGNPERRPLPTRGHHADLDRPVAVVGVVSSAGGPQVLERLLSGMPTGVLPPILLVQHLAAGFGAGFAEWLARSTGYPVRLAQNGLPARPGEAYLGPEGAQFWMDRDGTLVVVPAADSAFFRPSGDRLFAGLAAEHGPRAAGIVLSGMGEDGATGALALHRAGGRVLVQADAPIDGMPGAAVARGAADAVLPVARIADWLREQRTTP